MNVKMTIKAYIKERVRLLAAYAAVAAVFYAVSGLYGYGQSMKNMSYALVLAGFFGLCFAVRDCIHYIRRNKLLYEASQKEGERSEYLPGCRTLAEEYYRDMLESAEREKRLILSEYDEKKKDMADYYTMWTHQIKTPIAALRLLLQEEEISSGQAVEELFKIEQYAEMALHYARLDSLSSDLMFREYDVYEVMKQAVKKYAVLFIGSGLSFSMEECSCHAVTDEKWLSFVLEQILSNALKYTPHGGIYIYGQDSNGNKTEKEACCLVVEDTGIGISRSDLPRIFERGFTGYNGRLDKRSTGIGLYLCRQILDRLSHTIQVESSIGVGTKVTIGFIQKL